MSRWWALLCVGLAACAAGDLGDEETVEGAPCDDAGACADPLVCVPRADSPAVCLADCAGPSECASGQCDIVAGASYGYCVPPPDQPDPPPLDAGVVVKRNDGNPCTADAECAGGRCLTVAEGFPDGYCTTLGCVGHVDCNGNDVGCIQGEPNRCVQLCTAQPECRAGYECAPIQEVGFCRPAAPPAE